MWVRGCKCVYMCACVHRSLRTHSTLQFMIDYNLYGMNLISLSALKFRLGEGQRGAGRVVGVVGARIE